MWQTGWVCHLSFDVYCEASYKVNPTPLTINFKIVML